MQIGVAVHYDSKLCQETHCLSTCGTVWSNRWPPVCQHHFPLLILTSLWNILKLLCPSWLVCFPCLSFSFCHHGLCTGRTIHPHWWWGWGCVWLPDPQHHHHCWCHLHPPLPYNRSQRPGLLPTADPPASLALLVSGNSRHCLQLCHGLGCTTYTEYNQRPWKETCGFSG